MQTPNIDQKYQITKLMQRPRFSWKKNNIDTHTANFYESSSLLMRLERQNRTQRKQKQSG